MEVLLISFLLSFNQPVIDDVEMYGDTITATLIIKFGIESDSKDIDAGDYIENKFYRGIAPDKGEIEFTTYTVIIGDNNRYE